MRVNADTNVTHHRTNHLRVVRRERFTTGLAAERHQAGQLPRTIVEQIQFDLLRAVSVQRVVEKTFLVRLLCYAFFVNCKPAFVWKRRASRVSS